MKRKRDIRPIRLGVVLLLVAVIPALSACAPTQPAKPEERWLTVPVWVPMTGPYAVTTAGAYAACEDYVRWRNEQGGVGDGVMVSLTLTDHGAHLERAIPAYTAIAHRKPKPVAIMSWHTGIEKAMRDRFGEDMISVFTCSGDSAYVAAGTDPGWIFTVCTPYAGGVAAFMDWARAQWKEARPLRVGAITWDTEYGRGCMKDELIAYLTKKLGVEWVGHQFVPIRPIDTTTEITAIMAKNPDWILGCYHPDAYAVVLKDAARLGLRDKAKWVNNVYGCDETTFKLAGPAFIGTYGYIHTVTWGDKANPATQFMEKQFKLNARTAEHLTTSYIVVWAQMHLCCQAIDKALKKVGYEKLTGRDVYDAAITLEDDMQGLSAPVSFTKLIHYPTKLKVYKVEKDAILPLTDWIDARDVAPGGADVPK